MSERQFAWAPEDTPAWLRTHPSFEARGEQNFVEIDEAIGGEVPEELLAKGWGRVPQSMWDALLSKLHSGNLARAAYFHALQDDADHHTIGLKQWDSRAFGYIHILHNGSPVWWVDLEDGPVAAVTLFDLVVGTRQPAHDDKGHTNLWMMSLDQWDNAEYPPESLGGPPFVKGVSVAREAKDHFNDPWPPNEHGVIHTFVEMPKGPPRWLVAPTSERPHQPPSFRLSGADAVPVRIDTNQWKEILRADGYPAAHNLSGGSFTETPEDSIDRSAKWFLEVLTGGRRTEGDGSMSPNSIYIDAARYFMPRARFARYGKGKEKYGIWAGGGLNKKETIREILSAVIVTHEGSTVWLYDLEAGKPDRVLTLWELIGDWFVDVDGKRIGARQDTGAFGPLPVYFYDFDAKKKLWPMSEAQWAEGEWPSEDLGGPPAARYGMEMARETTSTTAADERVFAAAPTFTPEWLLIRKTPPEAKAAQKRQQREEFGPVAGRRYRTRTTQAKKRFLANLPKTFVEVAPPPWDTLQREDGGPLYVDHADWVSELDLLASYPPNEDIIGEYDQKVFRQSFGITHNGSPVWWVDLNSGPQRAATLYDLHLKPPPKAERDLWLMTIDQWDRAEYPPPSKGGPPFVKGVSTARENPTHAAAEDGNDSALICMGRNVVIELQDCDDIELPLRWGMLHDPAGTHWPKCSLLFTRFRQGDERDSNDEAVGYFGSKADIRRGKASMPLPSLHDGWHEVGIVKQIFYERAGVNEGRYKHKFNDPRGWMWLVALFKRRVAKTPPILFEYDDGKLQALRLELPDGCVVDDRGIALP